MWAPEAPLFHGLHGDLPSIVGEDRRVPFSALRSFLLINRAKRV